MSICDSLTIEHRFVKSPPSWSRAIPLTFCPYILVVLGGLGPIISPHALFCCKFVVVKNAGCVRPHVRSTPCLLREIALPGNKCLHAVCACARLPEGGIDSSMVALISSVGFHHWKALTTPWYKPSASVLMWRGLCICSSF